MTERQGLRSFFASIVSPSLIRDFFDRYAPGTFVWNDAAPDSLLQVCKTIRSASKEEYANLISAIDEIQTVCAERDAAERIVNALRTDDRLDHFTKSFRSKRNNLQDIAIWTMLNFPGTWERVCILSKARSISARSWDEFRLRDRYIIPNKDTTSLEAGLSKFLKEQTLHGEYVHVELEDEPNCDRYLISINSFPKNVQQFDKRGKYSVNRDENALNFIIEYDRVEEIIRERCPLDAKKRKGIAELFARIILNSELKEGNRLTFDLSKHLDEAVLPMPRNPVITNVQCTGLSIAFRNRSGSFDTCSFTTEGQSNIHKRMQESLNIFGVSKNEVHVKEVTYAFKIKGISGKIGNISAAVRPDGIHSLCRNKGIRNAIDEYLKMVLS